MDALREQLKKPLVMGAAGLVIGLLVGLIVLGWWLFPVQWTDATPSSLRSDLKQDYLRMTIDSYSKHQDKLVAQERWNEIGSDAADLFKNIQADPKGLTAVEISNFSAAVQTGSLPALTGTEPSTPVAPTSATTPTTNAKSSTTLTIGLMCFLGLLILAALAYVFVVRNRRTNSDYVPAMSDEEEPPADQSEHTFTSFANSEPPVAQFMTTYMSGDDLYDDSFSIDSPSGEFLGECGVGISETIGVGDPKKVTAFEVWLFDKNDIQTVTKVLMSQHAFEDTGIRQKLESKGEPILTEPGKKVLLETASLQLEARVVDMNYGQGAMPPSSYLDRLTLELAVWPKQQKQ
jgi:hypothetical protein